MRVLVTGATGLVGRQLSRELFLKGHDLVVVGRSPEASFREGFSIPCEYHSWDNLKLSNIDAVFHLAGAGIASGRWTTKRKKIILESRTKTTQSLAEALEGQWPSVYIGASAIGYYGTRGDKVLSEDDSPGEGFLSEVCVQWEEAHRLFESHSRTAILRLGVVLDSNQGFLEPMEELFSLGLGGRVSDGEQWLSWIHIDDLVRAFLFALEQPIRGVFNAVAPQPVTNREWTKAYSQQLQVGAYLPAPAFMLKLVLGEMSALALNSQRVSCAKLMEQDFEFKFETLQGALEDIYQWKKKKSHRIHKAEQWISAQREDVFPFFAEAKNLEKITPPWLNFKVLRQSTDSINEGTLIDYTISLKGLPMKWRTNIATWKPPEVFVDNQLRGPYKKWHHTHSFEPFDKGTLMKDQVVYELPMGRLGQLVAGQFVKKDVSKIFAYRTKVISQLQNLWVKS